MDHTTSPPSHPAATLFPMMTDEEYRSLVDDIRTNGLAEPVVYWCNKLLDGRNRLRACDELGITPESVELDEDDKPKRKPVELIDAARKLFDRMSSEQRQVVQRLWSEWVEAAQ